MENAELLKEVTLYVRRKFASRPAIADAADDIVQQAFVDTLKSTSFDESKLNFGYLSKAALRGAYKYFHNEKQAETLLLKIAPCVSEGYFAEEIESNGDSEAVLDSLETLREVERIVVTEHYYGQFTFAEIARSHGLNLNTVLSRHRRALEKLRSELAGYYL